MVGLINEKCLLQNDKDYILETLPIRDQLADIIRRMIIKGELKAYEQISERQLSQRFETSTTPIKEALRILQAEGLVYSKARVGTFVAEISPASILQIVTMRGALEGVAANFAAQNCTESEITQMSTILDEVRTYIGQDQQNNRIATLNAKFHHMLRSGSHNTYLVNLIGNMNSIDRTIRTLSFELQDAHREVEVAFKEHKAILEAVRAHDPVTAESLMNNHIRRVAKEVTNNG